MADQDIQERAVGIIMDQLGIENRDQVTPEARFVEDLNADSLDVAELVMKFEEEFGIRIPQEQQQEIRTVGESIAAIEKLQVERKEKTGKNA